MSVSSIKLATLIKSPPIEASNCDDIELFGLLKFAIILPCGLSTGHKVPLVGDITKPSGALASSFMILPSMPS